MTGTDTHSATRTASPGVPPGLQLAAIPGVTFLLSPQEESCVTMCLKQPGTLPAPL